MKSFLQGTFVLTPPIRAGIKKWYHFVSPCDENSRIGAGGGEYSRNILRQKQLEGRHVSTDTQIDSKEEL